jgi:hypothetical protein
MHLVVTARLALKLLVKMACAHVGCDTIKYNAAVSACERSNRIQLVEQLLLLLLVMIAAAKVKWEHDTITYNAAVSA